MSQDRLTSADKRVLLLWVFAGIAGALFAYKFYFRAFPEAAVNFKISRSEALSRAGQFVSTLGESTEGYQSVIVFNVDDNAKTYLEREVGLEQANRLMASQLNIWYWDVRFFKPQQEEEFRVRINPAGNIVGYEHHVEEARAGPSPGRAAAQTYVQNFLDAKEGVDRSSWELLPEEVNSTKRTNRLDWSFTWEKKGFRAKDAPYRLHVSLLGDKIGESEEFLKVPEAWQRSYKQLRSTNVLYNQIAIIPYILLFGSALWIGISLTRRGQANWKGAIKLGGLIALLFFLMQLNQWQSTRAEYDTHDSYSSFVALQIGLTILEAIATALMVTLVLPGAEPLYRAAEPQKLRLSKAFTLRGLQSREFFSSAVIGLSLAAAHIGFIVAFYMFGSKVGIWAPQDVNYSDAVNTSFPWIAGVAIGLMASTSEEFLFRLFAVPFIAKLTKSRVLAVILPAFSWSFLHSAYPQEPGYTRGIEVGIIGIVAGIVLLRWGIIATLIWHYTVDASLVGLLLIRSNSMYFKVSGVIVGAAALAPLLFSGIYYLSRGKFADVEDLLNVAEPAPEITFAAVPSDTAVAPKSSRRYQALTSAMFGVLALCLVAGALLAWRVQPSSIGDYLKLSINARTAKEHADEVIRRRGLDPASYYHATLLTNVTDPGTNEFLRERIGVKNLNDIYSTRVPGALWRVRYFRDSQPEEFNVVLKPDGSLHSVHHTMSEDAPGTLLTKEQAITRAQEYLTREKHLDLSQWSLVESKSDKHPHRTDHTLTWQENAPLDAGSGSTGDAKSNAYARMELKVLGDEVSSYRTYIKIPDDWRRRQEELTLPRVLISIALPAVVFGGLTITVVILFLMHLRSEAAHSIPWRRIGLWGVWGLLAYILIFAFGNRIATFLNAYQTAIPFKTMLETLAVGVVIGGPLYFSAIVLLFGMAWFFARETFAEEQLPGWAGMHASYYRDALWIGLGGTAVLVAIARTRDVLSAHWPTLHRAVDSSFGGDYDATLPSAAVLGTALFRGLAFTGIVVLIASFVASRVKNPFLKLLFFFAAALALVGTNWGTPADFLKQFVVRAIFMAVAYFGVKYLARFNLLGIFLVIAGSYLLAAAAELLSQPDHFYRANGYALLVLLFLLLSWPLLAWRANPTPADT